MKKKKPIVVSSPSSASCRMHDWSEIPRDISNLIADKMRFLPHLQKFGATCKEWRDMTNEIMKPITNKIKSEPPPLLLLPYNEETQIATFLEIKNSKMYNMKMPEMKHHWICGASNGWLAMTDDNLDLFLFNPLTRARIKLPPLHPSVVAEFRERFPPIPRRARRCFVNRVVLSDDPSSPNCLVAIIYSAFYQLSFCRSGDENWSVASSKWELRHYDDIIIYQGDVFAAVPDGYVHVFDCVGECKVSNPRIMKPPARDAIGSRLKRYLVESCGELLLVLRFGKGKKNHRQDKPYRPHKTWRFEVFKLNTDMESWDKVKSLGERLLFLGPNDSISVSAKDFSWCKPDCIYFTQDTQDLSKNGYQWDNGVYCLKENRVLQKFDIQHSLSLWPAPALWFRHRGLLI